VWDFYIFAKIQLELEDVCNVDGVEGGNLPKILQVYRKIHKNFIYKSGKMWYNLWE
jgi:hypothetical protein